MCYSGSSVIDPELGLTRGKLCFTTSQKLDCSTFLVLSNGVREEVTVAHVSTHLSCACPDVEVYLW